MSFGGLDFIFDNYHSSLYGLKIMSINGNNISESSGGCGVEIFEDRTYRNPIAQYQGIAQNAPLEFNLELVSETEIPGILRSKISKWLFGRMKYCKLQVIQKDLQDIYFNCHLIEPTFVYIGNYCHGINCKVRCDAPWAWQTQKTYQIIPNAGEVGEGREYQWKFYNDSDDSDYTYPVISFKMRENGNFSIENVDDNERVFSFTDLTKDEEIIVDCRNQLIKSSTGLSRSKNFNKKFFRLVPSWNTLNITGDFVYFNMEYSNARKVGG